MTDWDTYAAGFKETRQLAPEVVQEWMDRVADLGGVMPDDLPAGPWLDAGAGVGRFSGALADRWRRPVVALELQPAMLAGRARHADVGWVCGTVHAVPFEPGTFAGVWVHYLLHQVGDWRAALGELTPLVGPGGLAAVCTLDPDAPAMSALQALFGDARAAPARRWIDPAAIAGELEDAGFRTTRNMYIGERTITRDQLVRRFEQKAFSWLHTLDDDTYAACLERIRTQFPPGHPPIQRTDQSVLIVGRRL